MRENNNGKMFLWINATSIRRRTFFVQCVCFVFPGKRKGQEENHEQKIVPPDPLELLVNMNSMTVMWNSTIQRFMWKECTLNVLTARQQRAAMQEMLMRGNIYEWKKVWNISCSLWVHINTHMTKCNDTICTGVWEQYNVSKAQIICQFYVLPVMGTNNLKTNETFDLTLCVTTMNSNPRLPKVPFSECLSNVYVWEWNNTLYALSNHTIIDHFTGVEWEVYHSNTLK